MGVRWESTVLCILTSALTVLVHSLSGTPPSPWIVSENNSHTNDIRTFTRHTTLNPVDTDVTLKHSDYVENSLMTHPTFNNETQVDAAERDDGSARISELPETNFTNSTMEGQPLKGSGTFTPLPEDGIGEGYTQTTLDDVKARALRDFMQIFSFGAEPTRGAFPGPAPEFMIDLYNTVTDSDGVTRAKHPYDAHIVRSFPERDSSLPDYFYFNVSGLEGTERVVEAELHVHRFQTPHEQLHPSLYLTPFYILSLYQVLDPNNLAIPDLHQLLGVHYVPALGSGWEVFNVKQSVLKWMSGQTNYGFLVAATSLGGDRVPVRFSRRTERTGTGTKQPILVLFTQDSTLEIAEPLTQVKPPKVSRVTLGNATDDEVEDEPQRVPTSSLENPRFHHALLYKDSIRHPDSVNRFRLRWSKNQIGSQSDVNSETLSGPSRCGRQNLLVNFTAIGWSSWIISPKVYNAFHCAGSCSYPLGQEMKPSNHATVQSIMHLLDSAQGAGTACCGPTKLAPISVLYYDDQNNIVLRQYPDMVAQTCGCL